MRSHTTKGSSFHLIVLIISFVGIGCSQTSQTSSASAPNSEWHKFQGDWTAAGSRDTLLLGGERKATISNLSGSLVLTGPSRPALGFRADAIVFNDSVTGMVGRAVWTDERGDHMFSELQGEGTTTNNKILGTFLGGTGRYAGATGSYEFSWRFQLETEDGTVQGQSIGLGGRVRVDSSHAASSSEARDHD